MSAALRAGDIVRSGLDVTSTACVVTEVGDGWAELRYLGSDYRWRLELSLIRRVHPEPGSGEPNHSGRHAHARNVATWPARSAEPCRVVRADWPYECGAKDDYPDHVVYRCEPHGVWWHEATGGPGQDGQAMTVSQIVYRYTASLTGSGEFAVWHLGAAVVTVYGPEGDERKVIRLASPDRASAGQAARWHRPDVISETASSGIYPREAGQ